MMHVTGVGTVAALTVTDTELRTISGVIAAIAISIATGGNAGIAIGTVISTTIEPGVVTGKPFLTPFGCIRIMAYPASCGCGGTGRRAGLRSL